MSNSTTFDNARRSRRISEQAIAWYIEQQEDLSERQRVAFLEWLRASPEHIAEYLAVAQMHGDFKAAAAKNTRATEELIELARREDPVVMFPRLLDNRSRETPDPASRHRRMGRALPRIAAAMVAAILLLLGGSRWHAWDHLVDQTYVTGSDEVRSVALSDGTLVQIGKNSRIDVHFDARRRRIEIVRGNALFDVGKDHARPMLVSVGDHVLQDIGTVFDVRREAGTDILTVLSGRVRVWDAASASPESKQASTATVQPGGGTVADLISGQQVELRGSGAGPVHPAQIAQATAWLPEHIQFRHETVADVARRFNAYTTKPLMIEGERIANMRISGVFHANDPKAFIAYLATLPEVRVEQNSDGVRVVALPIHDNAKARRL
jgi:transmembrane sensor